MKEQCWGSWWGELSEQYHQATENPPHGVGANRPAYVRKGLFSYGPMRHSVSQDSN